MNCINCGNQLSNDAKFCNMCGKPVEIIKSPIKPQNKTLEKICDHLQFLGFNVEIVSEKEGQKEYALARHAQKYNIAIMILTPNIILFKTNLITNRNSSPAADSFMNTANRTMACTKVYYDVEEGKMILRFEAFYIGEYSKEIFSEFFNVTENDMILFNKIENYQEIFLDNTSE